MLYVSLGSAEATAAPGNRGDGGGGGSVGGGGGGTGGATPRASQGPNNSDELSPNLVRAKVRRSYILPESSERTDSVIYM